MKYIYYTLTLVIVLLASFNALAQSNGKAAKRETKYELVGTSRIYFPTPKGFVRVTPEIKRFHELAILATPKGSKLYAFFVQDSMSRYLNPDTIFKIQNYIRVQAVADLKIPSSLNDKDLARLFKEKIKSQNEEAYAKIIEKVNSQLLDKEDDMIRVLEYDPNLKAVSLIPVKGYEEGPSWISYGAIMKMNSDDGEGKTFTDVLACAAAFVIIKRQMIFIYVYAQKNEMVQAKKTVKAYVENFVAANNFDSSTHATQPTPTSIKQSVR